MTFNLLKKYSDLLELKHLGEYDRINSLKRVFERDITNNPNFQFQNKKIYPVKADGVIDMEREFKHLTCKEIEEEIDGRKYSRRVYDSFRSERLHWIKCHIDEQVKDSQIEIFSTCERDRGKHKDVYRTYIYNVTRKYVVILEPQIRNRHSYYLLSAYYLNESYGEKQMNKKMKSKIGNVL